MKKKTTEEMLEEMASVADPFGLFEPHVWKDKIGDILWHCEIQNVGGAIWGATGQTFDGAVAGCYNEAMKSMPGVPEEFDVCGFCGSKVLQDGIDTATNRCRQCRDIYRLEKRLSELESKR